MKLFLFTNFFPYQKSEPFLVNEFPYAEKKFNEITVLPLYGQQDSSHGLPNGSVTVFTPPLAYPTSKSDLFFKGIFNLAPIGFHLRDFFTNAVFLSPKKLYWFLVSLVVTRSVLSSKTYKELVNAIEQSPKALLYFYWGDNLSWIIPYLEKKIRKQNIKIILRLHGSDLYEHVKGNYAPLRKSIFSRADAIYTVSENGSNYLQRLYPEFQNKIHIAYLGVNDHGLNPYLKSDTVVIASVANLVALKRIHLIFEALQQTNSRIEWHHFGGGPLFDELKNRISNKRNGLDIKLHGAVPNKEIMDFYQTRSVDLFINVSSSEGLPVAVMEALSFGIPVIATNVGGTSELVNDTTGKLLDADFKISELSTAVEALAIHNNSEKRMAARNMFLKKVNAEKNYTAFYNLIATDDQ